MDNSKESHLERTADEPRDLSRHTVVVAGFRLVGRTIRVLRLEIPPDALDIVFRPGQWIDTFCPGVAKAGGFTLTSAPSLAASHNNASSARYIELAVRQSPDNPAAEWLWQPEADIVGHALQVRVGGSFVYPPLSSLSSSGSAGPSERVVFVAGGVGINPLMSMLSYMGEHQPTTPTTTVEALYSVREEEEEEEEADGTLAARILFLDRLAALFAQKRLQGTLRLFLTDSKTTTSTVTGSLPCGGLHIPCEHRRIATADLDAAVLGGSAAKGDADTSKTYVYVCGVPAMTDAFVAHLLTPAESGGLGMSSQNVFFEKWW